MIASFANGFDNVTESIRKDASACAVLMDVLFADIGRGVGCCCCILEEERRERRFLFTVAESRDHWLEISSCCVMLQSLFWPHSVLKASLWFIVSFLLSVLQCDIIHC